MMMTWQAGLTTVLTLSVLAGLIFTRAKPHVVMLIAVTILLASGILTASEALAGFSNSGLVTVAAMFIVAGGMHASGAIDLLVKNLLGQPRAIRGAYLRLFPPVVFMSAFLNNTPVVATMIPAISAWSKKIGISPSKLMIPLSYAAILGGTLTLIGTSTNLVVNGQYQSLTGEDGFSLFDITFVGLPVALAGLLMIWLFFPRWLPDTSNRKAFDNLREFTFELSIEAGGPLEGKTISESGLRSLSSVYLVEIDRDGTILTAVPSEERLKGNDRLVFAGDTEGISELLRIRGIMPSTSDSVLTDTVDRPERCLVEAVISPHCAAVGKTIREAQFLERYGAVVLAVARHGERVRDTLSNIRLSAGDTLLLEARPAFVSRQRFNKDFLLVSDTGAALPRHDKAYLAWAILATLVAAAALGLLTMLNAALIGACLMIVTGCCSVNQAENSLDLTVIITIACSFALGAALHKTGVAELIAGNIVTLGGGRIWLLLILTYLTVSLLTEIITNNAAAILMLPIVLELTQQSGIAPDPFVLAIMIAASASFATPLGYQTNLMVYGPGSYSFRDFLKAGIPMNLVCAVVCVAVLLAIGPWN